jgi:molybdopterin-guanine dinucleotide biosynthesis protein
LKIVVVSGASKDVGKTALAVSIIREYEGVAALKYSLHSDGDGSGVVTDPRILERPESDTGRFLEAGAKPVFWVRTDESKLGLHLKKALSQVAAGSKVIIEGNSVLKHLKPSLSVFVMNSSWEKMKESGLEALRKADIVVGRKNNEEIRKRILIMNPQAKLLTFDPSSPGGKDFALFLRNLGYVWRENMEERVLEALKAAAKRDRISCHHARKIAEELKVPYRHVGQAADELKIKIFQCELGCF